MSEKYALNVIKSFEVYFDEMMTDDEIGYFEHQCEKLKVNAIFPVANRMMVINEVETVVEVIEILAKLGLALEVGLIKENTEYWPNWAESTLYV